MADYPMTPSFGFNPGQSTAMPSYSGTITPTLSNYGQAPQDQAQAMAALMQSGGFPGFSAAAVASGVPPLPIYQTWDPSSYPPRMEHTFQHAPAIDRTGETSISTRLSATGEPSNTHPTQDYSYRHPVAEEGELSEGEYEDPDTLRFSRGSERTHIERRRYDDEYRPEYGNPVRVQQRFQHQKHEKYSQDADGQIDKYGRSLDLSHPRSESYSPHISPIQTARAPAPAPVNSHSVKTIPHPNNTSVSAAGFDNHSGLEDVSTNVAGSQTSAEQSLRDARKEAQSAILNLWPFKVRLEHYLEEGIDEAIVRQQFAELGMLPTNNDHKHPNPMESEVSDPKGSQPPASSTLPGAADTSPKEKVEERKDRIARLLAEKSKKLATPTQPEKSVDVKPTEATVANSAKADKEKLLRQKMEALQKSREARALKAAAAAAAAAAAKTSTPTPATNVDSQSKDTLLNGTKDASVKTDLEHQVSAGSQLVMSTSASPSGKSAIMQNTVSIPGLFLSRSTSNTPSTTAMSIPISGAPINQRKRPVASDFDVPTTTGPYKRPFGHNMNDQPLVIDVSDEESDTDADYSKTEMDYQIDNTSGHTSQNPTNVPKNPTIRDLPPLSDFPPRKVVHQGPPSSAPQTPPANKIAGKPEDLQKKEMEIQELRRKIALVEQRKRAKKDLSNSQSMIMKPTSSGTNVSTNQMSLSDKIEASVQIEQLMQDANRQLNQDQEKIVQTQASVTEQFAELNGNEAEQRRLRRAKIVADLPLVDAEVEASQKKLAELRAEMEKLESAVAQSLDNKRRLAEEMERLGREAEDQLQEQKDKLRNLVNDEPTKNDAKGQSDEEETPPAELSPLVAKVSEIEPRNSQESRPDVEYTQLAPLDVITSRPKPVATETVDPLVEDDSPCPAPHVPSGVDIKTRCDRLEEHDNAQSLDAALQNAIASAEAESMAGVGNDTDMENSYAPDPTELPPSTTATFSNNGPEDSPMNEAELVRGEGESDQYEPPEATPPASDDVPMSMDSPPFSPAPPETAEASGSVTLGADVAEIVSPLANTAEVEPPNLLGGRVEEPKKRPLPYSGSSKPRQGDPNQIILGLTPNEQSTSYTPYDSPLKRFRAFRFHPNFLEEVPGGFKSLTYSNNIRPDQEICRYELAGGVCNDKNCEFQHFRTMSLADDAILVELGNSAGYSDADKPKFISGLRNVLQDLRTKKTKDFKVIAAEIAAYRTRFLNDKSKVLLLEDISI